MTVEISYWSWKVNKELKIQELKDHLRGTEITRNYDGSSARELKPLIWKNINGNVKVNRDSVDDCNKNWSKEQGEHLFHPLSPLVQRYGKEKSYSWDGCKKIIILRNYGPCFRVLAQLCISSWIGDW